MSSFTNTLLLDSAVATFLLAATFRALDKFLIFWMPTKLSDGSCCVVTNFCGGLSSSKMPSWEGLWIGGSTGCCEPSFSVSMLKVTGSRISVRLECECNGLEGG